MRCSLQRGPLPHRDASEGGAMPNNKQTNSAPTKALSRAQYRYECVKRHAEFKQNFESLLFTGAVGAEELKGLQNADSPRTAEFAAAFASNTELIEAALREKWPHLFKRPTIKVPLYRDTTEDE